MSPKNPALAHHTYGASSLTSPKTFRLSFSPLFTTKGPSDVTEVCRDISLVWVVFICTYVSLRTKHFDWPDGLYDGDILLRTNFKRWPHSSWQWQRCYHACLWISLLFLPFSAFPLLSPSIIPTSPALNYELTARHNYDILASTLKMGAEQCSESLVSILIYQGHGVSVSFNIIILLFSSLYFLKWR